MEKNRLNNLITTFIIFLIIFSVIYSISLYVLTQFVNDINLAMILHLLNVFVMLAAALFITKHLRRFIFRSAQ
ncbi:hypothetical protein [Corticicoccus populi]|uniref:Uncharacterized protein n=1 Tax=Corticicoccus populi TaxID=1812821 RepID=A0ABW5WYG0_9STAP